MPRIKEYQAHWISSSKVGVFKLKYENGGWSDEIKVKTPEEFSVIIDLLRNESPIYHSPGNDAIVTFEEPVGEGE